MPTNGSQTLRRVAGSRAFVLIDAINKARVLPGEWCWAWTAREGRLAHGEGARGFALDCVHRRSGTGHIGALLSLRTRADYSLRRTEGQGAPRPGTAWAAAQALAERYHRPARALKERLPPAGTTKAEVGRAALGRYLESESRWTCLPASGCRPAQPPAADHDRTLLNDPLKHEEAEARVAITRIVVEGQASKIVYPAGGPLDSASIAS
jgi:hypothetical protein